MDPSVLVGREPVGSNLESVLMEQKMRADKHRVNFDALKTQHIVLQEVGEGGRVKMGGEGGRVKME